MSFLWLYFNTDNTENKYNEFINDVDLLQLPNDAWKTILKLIYEMQKPHVKIVNQKVT
jgi:hypothetical protein